jgi:hypothetical protein
MAGIVDARRPNPKRARSSPRGRCHDLHQQAGPPELWRQQTCARRRIGFKHEALLVVCGAEHALADGRAHEVPELAGERWVAFPPRVPREGFALLLGPKGYRSPAALALLAVMGVTLDV